jgi:2-isopropylmalate synthase
MKQDVVRIFDTTLRDGEQSPGYSMTLDEKLRLAVQLEKLNVDAIEAGFPAASRDDFAAVEAIAKKLKKPEICGLARAMESDIKTTWDAIKDAKKPRIHTFIATSPVHMKYKLKKSESEVLAMTEQAVRLAKVLCERVDFSPEDAGRSDREFLKKVVEVAIEHGADVINIPDTVGYLMPDEFGDLIKFLVQECKGAENVIFSTHCHNDLGLGAANSLAGVINGARQIECTINGIGERAGNAALEEVVMAIHTRPDFYHLKTNVKTREIMRSSTLLKKITGQPVQPNKAIVGRNAFAHESGIHQHGFLANRETYEIMQPEDIGLAESNIILGKHSGRAALGKRLQELGYELNSEQLGEVFIKFKELADKKKLIEDADLDAIMLGEGNEKEQPFVLEDVIVHTGISVHPTATVVVKTKAGEVQTAHSTGDGPVDAAFKALKEIVGDPGVLTEFRMDAVTEGIDAQAVVSLTIKSEEGKRYFGRSGNTDIVVASVMAYLDAVCKQQRR